MALDNNLKQLSFEPFTSEWSNYVFLRMYSDQLTPNLKLKALTMMVWWFHRLCWKQNHEIRSPTFRLFADFRRT